MKKRITTLAFSLLLGMVASAQNDLRTKKWSNMEQQIISTISTVFSGVDAKDWQRIKQAMGDKVVIDYTSLNGGTPGVQTPEEITDAWAALLPGFDKTIHQISNFKITIKGNEATAHYSGTGEHFIKNDVWRVEGTYETSLEKQKDKWRVTKHKFNLLKQSGDMALPAMAMEAVKTKEAEKTKNLNAIKEKITFNSEGLILAGHLYKPKNFSLKKKYPAILVGGSWTTVKEQMSGIYAAALAENGYIALAIDPRYFGESEGQPRYWENPSAKITDYMNAITYLETVEGVDANNIFLTAICASAGYMANVAAEDKRIKGFATVAGWLHDAESVKPLYGGERGVQAKIREAKSSKRKFAETGEVDYILTVSKTDKTAAMPGDFPYYQNSKRGAIPQWSADKFAVMSWEDWLTFDPMPLAKNIHKPTLMIHSDSAALPDNAKKFFSALPHDNKVLHWTKGTQFDFYDQPKQVSEAVTVINRFFQKLLTD